VNVKFVKIRYRFIFLSKIEILLEEIKQLMLKMTQSRAVSISKGHLERAKAVDWRPHLAPMPQSAAPDYR
jgi:hypothetical protein